MAGLRELMPLSRAMTKYKLLLPLILFLVHCGSSDEGNPSSNEPPPDYFAPTFSVNGFNPRCEYMRIPEIYPPPYEGQELSCRTSDRLFTYICRRITLRSKHLFQPCLAFTVTQAQPKPI